MSGMQMGDDRSAAREPAARDRGALRYRELIQSASARAGRPFDLGRVAGEATIIVLTRVLDAEDRQRLLAAVPTELRDDQVTATWARPGDLAEFLGQVATIAGRTPEQARHDAQAVLSALAEQDPELVGSLDLPPYLADLLGPPPVGGGVVGPAASTPPLTDDQTRQALSRLRRWSGDRRALSRTIWLPPDNLDRVLRRVADLKPDLGRGPKISRGRDGSATLTVRTASVDAVTSLDVDLAERIDAVIEEAGAGMNAG